MANFFVFEVHPTNLVFNIVSFSKSTLYAQSLLRGSLELYSDKLMERPVSHHQPELSQKELTKTQMSNSDQL